MHNILFFFIAIFLIHSEAYSTTSLEETFSSSPEDMLSLTESDDFLIHSLIHPLSGQPCLSQVDMVAQGAQPVEMKRIFIPNYTPLNEDNGQINPSERSYAGWVYCPHAHLNVFRKEETQLKLKRVTETLVSVADPHGIVLTYMIDYRGTFVKTRSLGICNGVTDCPSGKNDPRNTKIVVSGTKVTLQAPDGTKRYYVCSKLFKLTLNKDSYSCLYCLLEKEILPNGKVLKYEYNRDRQVSKITSLDPSEQLVYASIEIQASPFTDKAFCTAYTGLTSSYSHRTARYFKDQKKCIDLLYPLQFTDASSPCFREEKILYASNRHNASVGEYLGRDTHFKYHPKSKAFHSKPASELFLPATTDFQSACKMTYTSGNVEKHGQTTSVSHCDGTKTVHKFTPRALPESVSYFDQNEKLVKSKVFSWTGNQWLQSLAVKDGDGKVLSEKVFAYDGYGNPIVEKFMGDLTGSGRKEAQEIKRAFSQDGLQLLLREENVKTVCFSYLPGTNLLASKLIKDKNDCVLREFRAYDKSYNLIQIIKDDGSQESADDLTDVTYRTVTDVHLRQETPFLHMPAAIEERYVENGQHKLLKRTEFLYDSLGNITQERIYDAEGQFAYAIDKTYDEQENLLSETNALGQKTVATFDSHGREKTSTNFANTLHRIQDYDHRGNLSNLQEAGEGISRRYTYSYDLKNRLVKKIDSYQNPTSYAYDLVAGLPSQIERPLVFSTTGQPHSVIEKSVYDASGRVVSSVDPNGNCTTFRYNAYGSPIEIVYPDQSREHLRYTKQGLLESHTFPNGLTIRYQYDVLGHVIEKIFSAEEQTLGRETFAYKGDLLTRHVDLEGHITHFSHDGAGRKTREDRGGHATTYHYDPLGNIDIVCEENSDNSLYTHFRYDLLGRVLEKKQTDAQGSVLHQIAYTYDPSGNIKTTEREINGRKAVESFSYDPYDREILHQDAEGFLTHTHYNEQAFNRFGQQVLKKTTTDPQNRLVEETFDAYGRLAKKETLNPSHETIAAEEHEYDPCGNATQHTDFIYHGNALTDQKVLAFTYDACHQVATSTRAFRTPDARLTRFSYYPGGNLAVKTLPDGLTLTYAYDHFDHLTKVSSSDGSLSHSFRYNRLGYLLKATDELSGLSVEREVDSHGNILQEKINGNTITKTYDNFNRPLSLSLPDHTKIVYFYNPLYLKKVGRLSPNSEYHHTYDSYDTSGFLIEEQLIADLGTVRYDTDLRGHPTARQSNYFSQTCQFDAVGNIVSQSIDDSTETFSYDLLSQLTEEPTCTYAYDSTHNRLQKNAESCQSNRLDEHLSVGAIACKYDLRGNLIKKKVNEKVSTFSYNPLDQLSEATIGNTKICFSYDPLGRRIEREQYHLTSAGWQQTSSNTLFYDGSQEIGQIENGKIQQLCVFGRQYPVAIELQDNVYAPLLDVQGNIRRLIHAKTGTVVAQYTYSAFGEQPDNDQAVLNPWQYAAKRLDFDLGLIDFGKRYYDPQLGRWLTLDPISFLNNRNLYQYNFNNPFRYHDPNGTAAVALFIPLVEIAFDFVVSWISTEALLGTVTGAAFGYGAYHLASEIQGTTVDEPADQTGTATEEKKKKGDRTKPIDLEEQLTLEEAKGEKGKNIPLNIQDPKYPESDWKKMKHNHAHPDGTKTEVHWWENIGTGARHGYKFKDEDNNKSRFGK